jgi:hypothetical protein
VPPAPHRRHSAEDKAEADSRRPGFRADTCGWSARTLVRAHCDVGRLLMLHLKIAIAVAAGGLWFAGLRLFLRSDLSSERKLVWSGFLVFVGIGIGVMLPASQIWRTFVILLVILPLLGLADVLLLRSGRSVWFWIRACGFEVCTVFGAAVLMRIVLDWARVAALLP